MQEVDSKFLNVAQRFVIEDDKSPTMGGGFASQFKTTQKAPPKAVIPKSQEHIPSPNFRPTPAEKLQEGQRVEHQKFGFGTILTISQQAGGDTRAEVDFEKHGAKTMLLTFAKLMVID